MSALKRYRVPVITGVAVVFVVGFLVFRPDKLFVDDVVDESLAEAFPSPTADTGSTALHSTTTGAADDATTTTDPVPSTTSPRSPQPTVSVTGEWFGIDHEAVGSASIYEQDGDFVLRFEDDTDIQNGPDLYVWLLAADAYEGGTPADYLDLGNIRGNVGGQNYPLPDDYDPDVHRAVLIWCLRFSVPFAAAHLA